MNFPNTVKHVYISSRNKEPQTLFSPAVNCSDAFFSTVGLFDCKFGFLVDVTVLALIYKFSSVIIYAADNGGHGPWKLNTNERWLLQQTIMGSHRCWAMGSRSVGTVLVKYLYFVSCDTLRCSFNSPFYTADSNRSTLFTQTLLNTSRQHISNRQTHFRIAELSIQSVTIEELLR